VIQCRRVARSNLTFSIYESLRHFPLPFLEKFVPSVADSGCSCLQTLTLAIEQYGSNPAPRKKLLKRYSVNLSATVYLAALTAAKKVNLQPQFWIEQVIKDYLERHPDVPNPPASAGPSVPNEPEATTPRPATSEPCVPVEVDLSADQAEVQGRARSESKQFLDERDGLHRLTDRPSYEQRRKEQIAAAGKQIPAAQRVYRSKIKIVFATCHGNAFIENDEGETQKFKDATTAHKFFTAEKAENAALEYSNDRGYTVWPRQCEKCSTDAKLIWHVFRDRQ
jgi:hypothetical protein